MFKLLYNSTHAFLRWQIQPEYAGFMLLRGTKIHIMNVQHIIEKCRKFHIPTWMCYIDYITAFDYMKWNELYRVLKEKGVLHIREFLHESNLMIVRIDDEESEIFLRELGCASGMHTGFPCIQHLWRAYYTQSFRRLKWWNIDGRRKISNLH